MANIDSTHEDDEWVGKLFRGRITRKHYILGLLLMAAVAVVPLLILFYGDEELRIFAFIILGVRLFFGYSLHIRRFHDLNTSGWMVLTTLIPIVNFIPIAILLFNPGKDGVNKYGSRPPLNVNLFDVLFGKYAPSDNETNPSEHKIIELEVADNPPTIEKSVPNPSRPNTIDFTSRHKIILAGLFVFTLVCSGIVYGYLTKERLREALYSAKNAQAVRTEQDTVMPLTYERYLESMDSGRREITLADFEEPLPKADSYLLGLQAPVARRPDFYQTRARSGKDPQGYSEDDVRYIQKTGLEPLKPNQTTLYQRKVKYDEGSLFETLFVGDIFKHEQQRIRDRFNALVWTEGDEDKAFLVAENWVHGDKTLANDEERAILKFLDKYAEVMSVINIVAVILIVFVVVKTRKQQQEESNGVLEK